MLLLSLKVLSKKMTLNYFETIGQIARSKGMAQLAKELNVDRTGRGFIAHFLRTETLTSLRFSGYWITLDSG